MNLLLAAKLEMCCIAELLSLLEVDAFCSLQPAFLLAKSEKENQLSQLQLDCVAQVITSAECKMNPTKL